MDRKLKEIVKVPEEHFDFVYKKLDMIGYLDEYHKDCQEEYDEYKQRYFESISAFKFDKTLNKNLLEIRKITV